MRRSFRKKSSNNFIRKKKLKKSHQSLGGRTLSRNSIPPTKDNNLTELWFKSLIENSLDIILVTDNKGCIVYASPSAERIFGYSIYELVGIKAGDFVHPEDLPKTNEKLQNLLKTKGRSAYLEERVRHKNGNYHWIETVITNLLDNPAINGLVYNFREISGRKRLEKILWNEKEALERASKGISLNENLSLFLKSLEEISQGISSCILFLTEDGRKVVKGPVVNLQNEFIEALSTMEIKEKPCSFIEAASQGQSLFCSDIEKDNDWQELRDLFIKFNVYSCYTFPLFSSSKNLEGVFLIFYNQTKTLFDEDKELIKSVLSIVEILIDKEKTQNQILQNEKMLKEISSSIPGAVFHGRVEMNKKFKFTFISEGIKELVGFPPEEIYKNWATNIDIIHREDQAAFYQSIQQSSITDKAWLHEFRVYSAETKSFKWIRGNCIPRTNSNGEIGWYGTLIDITNEKASEEFLRIQNRAIESAAEGILITYAELEDNPIIFVNKAFCDLTGYNEEEILGKNCRFLQGKDSDRNTISKIREAIAAKTTFKGEIVNYKKDGTAFWNSLVIAPVIDDFEKVTHFVGMVNDITERKKGEQKLLEQNTKLLKVNMELDRFVYSTSHDLRAPLTSILGLLDLAMDSNETVMRAIAQKSMHTQIVSLEFNEFSNEMEEMHKFISLAKQSVIKQEKIIQSILDYFRNNRTSILIEEIDLKALINDSFEGLEFIRLKETIKKEVYIHQNQPFCSDKNRIRILINNIISNCLKYSDSTKQSWIKVNAEINARQVLIEIEDNGIGIEESELPKIFDMFYRGTVKSNGSGLGLYVVKEIIEKLGGAITVESKIHEGTTFKVIIPNLL